MRDLLITGTDTGIGKTVVAAAIIKALRTHGARVIGFKPIETGVTAGEPPDSELLAHASGETVTAASPLLQLSEALAPAVAAQRAGMNIAPSEIEQRVGQLRRAGYTIVIEGAGGLMVPLTWEKGAGIPFSGKSDRGPFTALDIAERFGLDAVVVGRAGLGTLNHIALTVAMLQSRAVPIRAVILNGRRSPDDLAELTNRSALAQMLPEITIIEVPWHDAGSPTDATVP